MKRKILALLPAALSVCNSLWRYLPRHQTWGTSGYSSRYARNITYRREAYEYDCVMPRRQFERDFILVENKEQAVARRAASSIKKSGQCW